MPLRHVSGTAPRRGRSGGEKGRVPQPWPLRVQPGDVFVLDTESLEEARKEKNGVGVNRLKQQVAKVGGQAAPAFARGLVECGTVFTDGRGPMC
jgi:hypothetical protein